jgi:predicted alpha/beta-fold hydrolase
MTADTRLISKGFQPPLGLRHRHLQSVVSRIPWRRRRIRARAFALLAAAEDELIDCGDGVRLSGFYSAPAGSSRGLVIMFHGWEGSADSTYMLSAGARLFDAGFEVFRLNFRDHGNTHALNEGLFHSCRIGEVVGAVQTIQTRHPAGRAFIVGQSLGGNFACRVAARAPRAGIHLERVIAICPVLRPQSTMHALENGFWLYRQYFLQRWRRSLLAKAEAFPGRYDFGNLERFRTLTETTDFFVRQYTEFPDIESYLDGYAITGGTLGGLSVPTSVIAAYDDPVIPSSDLDRLAPSACLAVDLLPNGGHCGFIDSYSLRSWIDSRILAEIDRR